MKRLWVFFVLVMFVSFLILGWIGTRIYQEAPPIPVKVVTTDGTVVIDEDEIAAGQNVWQSLGGMEVGSVWGHGSYVAPDWTEDWLRREAIFILNRWANAEFGSNYEQLGEEQQAQLSGRLSKLMRTNTYDPTTQTVTIAGRPDANLGLGRARLLVRPQFRIHANPVDAESTLDASAGRHHFLPWRDRTCCLCRGTENRALLSTKS